MYEARNNTNSFQIPVRRICIRTQSEHYRQIPSLFLVSQRISETYIQNKDRPLHQMTKAHDQLCQFHYVPDKMETWHQHPSTLQIAWGWHFLQIHQYQDQKAVDHWVPEQKHMGKKLKP